MEFLLYLSPIGHSLLRDLVSAKFHIHENTLRCKKSKWLGYTETPNKFVICTNNIKNGGYDLRYYVNETMYHEAVHAAQICQGAKPLGIQKKDMPLPPNKIQDIKNSVDAVNDPRIRDREHEAYYFEDKPTRIRHLIRKYCF